MDRIKQTIRYLKLHLFRDPRYFFAYAGHYFNRAYVPQINFLDIDTTANLVAKGKSLIRLGDGEIYILNHGDIPFESSSPKLRALLQRCIDDYDNTSPYLIALNQIPLQKRNTELRAKGLLNCWLPSKVYFNLYFNRHAAYADAAIFYFRETIPKYFETYLRTKKIVFVSNERTCKDFKSNPYVPFTVDRFVITPEVASFAQYEEIKKAVIDAVDFVGKGDAVVLASFGPASKALALELSNEGIQVLDVGQGITAAYGTEDHSLSQNIRMLQ